MTELHDAVFKSLSDPTRRGLFEWLSLDGEHTVAALTERAKISQPAVSKHLGILRQAGLVSARHAGRQTHYTARKEALAPLIDWTRRMGSFWDVKLDLLEDLLGRMDQ